MSDSDKAILDRAGWDVECESPFEIRHRETGSFATKEAAWIVLVYAREADKEKR